MLKQWTENTHPDRKTESFPCPSCGKVITRPFKIFRHKGTRLSKRCKMTEQEFLSYNEKFKQRRAAIKATRKRSEPVRIGDIIPDIFGRY